MRKLKILSSSQKQLILLYLKHIKISWWIILSLLIFFPYFNNSVIPFHDTLLKYQFFHFSYSHLFNFNELPRWIPYGSYGISANFFQLIMLSPGNYLTDIIGLAFRITNTLFLFKLSILIDFIIYIFGIQLFANEAYKSKVATTVVTLSAIGSFSWLAQLHFNFYLYYLLPITFWCILKYYQSAKFNYIWLAVLIEAVSFIGSVPYFAPIHILIITIIFLSYNIINKEKKLIKKNNYFFYYEFLLASFICIFLIIYSFNALQGTINVSSGRDMNGFRVPLNDFLTYRKPPLTNAIEGLLTGSTPHADNSYYVGLLPIALVFWGLFRIINPVFIGLTLSALTLIWLSIGGFFSRIIYFFPTMMIYRHIGFIFGAIGVLLILASGFVVDFLIQEQKNQLQTNKLKKIYTMIFLLMILDWVFFTRQYNIPMHLHGNGYILFLFIIKLILYFSIFYGYKSISNKPQYSLKGIENILIVIIIFDILSFQTIVHITAPGTHRVYPSFVFQVNKQNYISSRHDIDNHDIISQQRMLIMQEALQGYAFAYNWIGADPCYPKYRNDSWQHVIVEALAARGGHPKQINDISMLPFNDEKFKKSLGCESSKILLIQNHINSTADNDIILLKNLPDPSTTLITRDGPEIKPHFEKENTNALAIVKNFNANRIEISLDIHQNNSLWLYYADAYDARWKAEIDGIHTKIYRANVGFKAVLVPPGKHNVIMAFTGNLFLNNLLALVGVITSISLIAWIIIYQRQSSHIMTIKKT
ncbi:MAG: YfhO family protein [Pseudomonadota bacterium]